MNVPKGWEMKKLCDICEIASGQGAPQGEKYFSSGTTPFIRAGDLSEVEGYLVGGLCEKVNEEGIRKHKLVLYIKGSIVFPKSGMSCMTGNIAMLEKDAYVVNHLAVLSPKNNVNGKFLFYLMKKYNVQTLIENPAYPSIKLSTLSELCVPIPLRSLQDRIVAILEKADTIKQKRQEANKKTNQLAQSVFLEMFGDPEANPKKWPTKTIGELCEMTSGGTPNRSRPEYYKNGTIPWVKSGEVNHRYIFNTEEKITEAGLRNSSAKYFESNTVLVAMYGATAGKVAVLKIKATTNQAIAGLFCMPNVAHYEYVHYCLEKLANRLISKTVGSGQPNLSQQIIKKLYIPLPPLGLQQQFARHIEKLEETKQKQHENLKYSEALFNSLMQRAFTGELVA